jgi:hypothetical protein
MDSSEVCALLHFLFFVFDVLSRYAFSWHSSLAKYVTRTTEARKCSSVIIVTAVRFRFCFCLLHPTDYVSFSGFHMFCLEPPLSTVPRGQWYCPTCIFGTGGDFGFDEGEEHSLSSFQARDREFRRRWFQTHPPEQDNPSKEDPTANIFGDVCVTEYDVEREFWRLVQSPHETVEIEYGADVHSTTHGR